ncbi:MAG: hypothetical protein HY821_03170 [Acidobacteria bacterium]|nr:hypothetical protein [Acidobacteriota bacterium]
MRAALFILVSILAPALRAQSLIISLNVSPSSVTFTAPDPSSSPAPASASISWWISHGSTYRTWTLRVLASPASVTNCPNVPLSAFTIRCASLGNAASYGSCAGPVSLSGTGSILATGQQRKGTNLYSANISVQFTDSWRYPGATSPACALTLSYTVEAP